eukprot:TRINITY_DN55753_c0_g2_i1.p1 TRINITY_DN55753_c0_g2~~TRINITY_DN55753_c0_g2_i1.p1  ORF type:complete len:196 (-),score=27.03 TRINITY_DN55753_c0_g2_i1:106-666(-)
MTNSLITTEQALSALQTWKVKYTVAVPDFKSSRVEQGEQSCATQRACIHWVVSHYTMAALVEGDNVLGRYTTPQLRKKVEVLFTTPFDKWTDIPDDEFIAAGQALIDAANSGIFDDYVYAEWRMDNAAFQWSWGESFPIVMFAWEDKTNTAIELESACSLVQAKKLWNEHSTDPKFVCKSTGRFPE